MKKVIIFALILMLVFPCILGVSLNVEKESANEVLIMGLNEPAVFDLKITNYGEDDYFQFYNLLGFSMFPIGTVQINHLQTRRVELKVSPIGEFNTSGPYTFNYFIVGEDGSESEQKLSFKVVELKDVFEVGASDINPETNSLDIYIHNKVNYDFENVNVQFSSAFFELEEDFSLGPNQRKDFHVELNSKDFQKLMAGFYTLDAEVNVKDLTADFESVIKFEEKDLLITTTKDYGFFVNTKIIEKENQGNIIAKSEISLQKNIISRLFTSFNIEPDYVERTGLDVTYGWNRNIKPGESLEIVVKTNWFFPILLVFFIIAVVILAKQYSKSYLVLDKKVTFMRTKGGEFALKVTIMAQAKQYIEKVNIIDRFPPLVKIHNIFGGDRPVRINEKSNRIEWNFERFEAGELRVLSYIIYSKVGVVGRFALPTTTAIFEKDGKIKETSSNRVFFVSEQKKIREDE